ncbi:PREDICTED: chaperone protein ClpD, chloroplastic [Fragaria vesca subsp. vesca]|uniref:chaperone protein ClpD, chloroplastic n=1 Tax=Fragaria vesca subsp. vesca TaxID=101020 RepID=UPI0002C3221B|nr:PREDICTED: chaperone protein ClpD, chloroplastic [Fragaria vesca subsp. vesca]
MHVSSSSSVLISSPLRWRTPSQHVSFTPAVASTSTTYERRNAVVSIRLVNPFSSSSSLFATPFHGGRRRKTSKLRVVSAVFERFTERAIKAVIFSQREAKALGRDMVFTQHLLLGLIAEEEQHRHLHPNSLGFLGSGMTLDQARRAVRSIWRHNSKSSQSQSQGTSAGSGSGSATDLSFAISTKRVLEAALEYSRSRAHNFLAPEHIVIGLLTVDDGSAGQVLKRLGVNVNQLLAEAASRLQIELAKDGREPSGGSRKTFSKKSSASSGKTKEKSALERFCVDLTARASEGRIDPVIGRDTEVQRIIQILCRRTKNNPILLGQSGVGKTAIVEGLATSIAQADVPVYLLTKRVMSLDVALLMAGAKERGELESRVTSLISDIQKSGNVILFIDEVHTLIESGTVGRGNKGSGLDIANIMKPALGRGKLQCIASTTTDEYRMHLEKDKAFGRRFQPVWINEPSQEDAVRILFGLRERYEAHHNCIYAPEAISAAVYLSARYIPDRYLPDKAIDLLDEAGSRARMEAFKKKKEEQVGILSKSADDYWQEIRTVQAMHEVVLSSELKYGAASVDNTSEHILDSVSSSKVDDEPTVVGPNDIAAVASLWSGVPLQQLTADDRLLLVGLDEKLRRRVVGQDEAVAAISRAVRRSRVGLKDPGRPMATMLFCGPTGVGKTELTKALAASYFGSEEAMVRLDMSEYMERHSVSKLIGSPPGYVGFGEGGTLTEAIRRRPFTVVVLDEIEKAHPDIFNILLQIFEDGHLTDSQGRRVSFKNALVVMTSNVGSTIIAKGRQSSIGFVLTDDESSSYAGIKATVMEELKSYFRPELLNRIDEVVVFHPLEKSQMLEIVNIMLQEVKQRLMSLGIGLDVSESVKDLICQEGYDRFYGARPLRRAITLIIEDPLSESLLSGVYQPGDTAVIDLDASGNPSVSNGSGQSSSPFSKTSIQHPSCN